MRLLGPAVALVLALTPLRARADLTLAASEIDEWLERLDRALVVQTPGGYVRADLSGLFDLEGYYIDQRPPGLIFGGDESFANPRLSVFLDTHVGTHLYSFVQARIDRGFDPRESGSAARFDEYLLRYTSFADPRLNVQVGKFASVIGNWVHRHHSWDNPFINAPLPYENVTIVSDIYAPATPQAFLARRTVPDQKSDWLPVVWGPSYTSGAAVFGRTGPVDYAVEVKNAALSSRPSQWDGTARGWDYPTVSGRLGWRYGPAWSTGLSLSAGPYLRGGARSTLPPGRGIGDYQQQTLGLDAAYAWRRLEVWAELFLSRFEVPHVGDADTAAYYIETRYRLTPTLFGALRWNQQFFGDVDDGTGQQRAWDRDAWRLDAAVTYRFVRHVQLKLQYSFTHQKGDLQQGEQLVAVQMTVKF